MTTLYRRTHIQHPEGSIWYGKSKVQIQEVPQIRRLLWRETAATRIFRSYVKLLSQYCAVIIVKKTTLVNEIFIKITNILPFSLYKTRDSPRFFFKQRKLRFRGGIRFLPRIHLLRFLVQLSVKNLVYERV